jgi:hypothetical protein
MSKVFVKNWCLENKKKETFNHFDYFIRQLVKFNQVKKVASNPRKTLQNFGYKASIIHSPFRPIYYE